MRASVVIPAYNEETYIGTCLESLARQTFTAPYEVIVVDNNSTDATASIARSFVGKMNIRMLHEPAQGRGAARATGCRAATGEYLLCTDADTIVPPEWIESFVSVLDRNPQAIGATSIIRISECTPVQNAIFNMVVPLTNHLYRLAFGHYWLTGASSAIRRDAYEKVGGFDAVQDSLEDVSLTKRLARHGKILVVSSMRVNFSARRFKNGFFWGLLTYPVHFFRCIVLGEKRVVLSSPR